MRFDFTRKDIVNNVVTNVFDSIEEVEAAQKDAQIEFEQMEKEMFGNDDSMTTHNPFNDVPEVIEDTETEINLHRIATQGVEYSKTVYAESWTPNLDLAYRSYPINLNAKRCDMPDDLIIAKNNGEDIRYVYYNGNDVVYNEIIGRTAPTTKTIPNDHKYDKIMVRFPDNPKKDYVTWTEEYKVEHFPIDSKHNYKDFSGELPIIREISHLQTKILIYCELDTDYNALIPEEIENEITPFDI